jgi:hypothetical protein
MARALSGPLLKTPVGERIMKQTGNTNGRFLKTLPFGRVFFITGLREVNRHIRGL